MAFFRISQLVGILSICASTLFSSASRLDAEERLLPRDWPIESVVDYYVDAKLVEQTVEPSEQANDPNLVRRMSLDLIGRMPSFDEVQEFLSASDADKRGRLVDRLLASKGFERHQVDELEIMLMYPDEGNIRDYLLQAVKEDRRWDQIFSDVVFAKQESESGNGASSFLKARLKDTDKLTNEVSVRFFGVNISCAQCHDHPLVSTWTQDHYYGMKSFFDRTFDNGGFVAEREFGLVSFTTTKGEQRKAKLMFLSGDVLDEPAYAEPTDEQKKAEKKLLDESKKEKKAPPAPAYSRRARLIDAGLAPSGRQWMARSLANRIWHRFFGHGLVMPLDQMHAENPPSHPELMQWLARDLIEHRFDVKRLIRGLVMSRAYSRDSAWLGEGSRPEKESFAVAQVRPLTGNQLAASLRVATIDPDSIGAAVSPADKELKLENIAQAGRALSSRFEMPRDEMQISVSEALFMSNSQQILNELLVGGLVARLAQMSDETQIVDTAMRSVLLRDPDSEERAALVDFLRSRSERKEQACRQVVWSLLTSTEFRFNY